MKERKIVRGIRKELEKLEGSEEPWKEEKKDEGKLKRKRKKE